MSKKKPVAIILIGVLVFVPMVFISAAFARLNYKTKQINDD